ncbi:hypothetical protein [Paludisphaera rhizosphaerae]|uniref:hypothetical protein n=1 Tax=Paludisphaera rhizosphaerae TaxID=2711216 RepID=UPI0013EA2C57|nr:hypothetical protein [Paludisphaera rhizosphaerae]
MPADEWRTWCKYHQAEGLPDLQLLFGHLSWITALVHSDGKRKLALEDFILRPAKPQPKPVGPPLSAEDGVDYLARLMGGRVSDRRV